MLGFVPIASTPIADIWLRDALYSVNWGTSVPRVVTESRTTTAKVQRTFDFTGLVPSGDSVASAAMTVVVYSGEDDDPSAILSGTPVISGNVVTQVDTDGVDGVIYFETCTATTANGLKLQLGTYVAVAG